MTTLTGRVVATALVVLCTTLLVVGGVTAGLLHLQAIRSLDQALLAAAFAEAHPWQEERFGNDHMRSPVDVRPWTPDDPLVPRELWEEAVLQEIPMLRTLAGRRVLILVLSPEGAQDTRPEDLPRFAVVAEAPANTVWDVAVPFLGIYLGVSTVATILAGAALRVAMIEALRPLYRATDELEVVRGLGSQARLGRCGVVEVDQLLDSTNALLERLEAAFDAQSTFTAQAAHELRTPVTILKGELELALRRDRSPAGYREALDRAKREVERLADLVEGLMLLSRVEAGHAERGREVERLSAVVYRAIEQERVVLEGSGCVPRVTLGRDPELRLHVALVATAIANLLRNAASYAPGSEVVVAVDAVGSCATVTVEDGGDGLAAEERDRVLERFQRGTTRREGLGLGLPLAREIARRHGGELVLGEAPGGGLRARLQLSCNSNEVQTEDKPPPV